MRVLITGANGQLGHDVMLEASRRGWDAIGADLPDFDLTDRAKTLAVLEKAQPDCVIHCAAYTAVDKAESEPELARAVNARGTGYIAEYCAGRGIWMLYVSTDYVFNGSGSRPREVDDMPAPLNVYGKTKLEGERTVQALREKHMIVRTSWVFGSHGSNFVKTMLRLGSERPELKIVSDQVGAPTYTADLARLLCDMADRPVKGIYHAANAGECSWAQFAAKIFELSRLPCRVNEIPSCEYPQPAQRPKNSRLSSKALLAAGYEALPPWESALADMLMTVERG